jgi:hypothetical protein
MIITYQDIEDHDADWLFEHMKGDVGSGWLDIVTRLHTGLKELYPGYKPMQIKEKFGGLRYYVKDYPSDQKTYEKFLALIRDAEREADETCEDCGTKEGVNTVSTGGWIRTLCVKDSEIFMERQKQQREQL